MSEGEELRASEARFRRMVEMAHEGIWEIDAEHRTTFVNPTMAEMLGTTVPEMLGLPVFAFMDDDGRATAERSLTRRQNGVAERFEFKYRRVDGGDLWTIVAANPLTDSAGRYVGALALVTDISDRRRTEQTLAWREAQLAEAQRLAHLGSWEWDIRNDRVWWSDEHYHIFGMVPGQDLPSYEAVLERMHADDARRVRAEGDACMRTGRPLAYDARILLENGEVRFIHSRASVVQDAAGRPVRMVGTVQDITERKLAEAERERLLASEQSALAELRSTQQQIVQHERLRALGQMASGIAHDFNNALAPVVAYSELLLEQPEKLSDVKRTVRFADLIYGAAQDAAGVVRRLREFYRQRDMDEVIEPVHLDNLVAQVVSLTQFRWKDQAQGDGRDITIKTHVDHLPSVSGNEAELREALTNLVLNAVDAMPHGGNITISTEVEEQTVTLVLRDTGVGMTEDVRLRCLEPFFTTKGEHGTGLGLGLVYGIVKRHHGTLDIDSTVGQGTSVRLRLPVWTNGTAELRGDDATVRNEPVHILVVEDEPRIRMALMEYLTADGHVVEAAPDGRAGLDLFKAGTFDLVLTDRALPEMSGDRLASAIKGLAPDVPIIMVTGFGDLMNHRSERPAGVDLVLGKPITLAALRGGIGEVLATYGHALTPRAEIPRPLGQHLRWAAR